MGKKTGKKILNPYHYYPYPLHQLPVIIISKSVKNLYTIEEKREKRKRYFFIGKEIEGEKGMRSG